MIEQVGCDQRKAHRGRVHQRRPALGVRVDVDVGALVDEEFDDIERATIGRPVEQGQLIFVGRIHIAAAGKKFLHRRDLARFRGLENRVGIDGRLPACGGGELCAEEENKTKKQACEWALHDDTGGSSRP